MRKIITLKMLHIIKGTSLGVLSLLMFAFSSTATAQCGGSLTAMAAAAASIPSQSKRSQSSVQNKSILTKDGAVNPSIVGLWHIGFFVETPNGPLMIQEAFQIWNVGGTEVHNPNVDPRTGNVCLGVWQQTAPQSFKLTHRVWNYDGHGIFLGTINLAETLTLDNRGSTHRGSFTLDFYDPDGNPVPNGHVEGTVVGERISVD
jgi:hypothetical protein